MDGIHRNKIQILSAESTLHKYYLKSDKLYNNYALTQGLESIVLNNRTANPE